MLYIRYKGIHNIHEALLIPTDFTPNFFFFFMYPASNSPLFFSNVFTHLQSLEKYKLPQNKNQLRHDKKFVFLVLPFL